MSSMAWLIDITVTSTIVVAVILMIRLLFKDKINGRVKYYLWFIFIIRLLAIPLPESKLSILNVIHQDNAHKVLQIIQESKTNQYNRTIQEQLTNQQNEENQIDITGQNVNLNNDNTNNLNISNNTSLNNISDNTINEDINTQLTNNNLKYRKEQSINISNVFQIIYIAITLVFFMISIISYIVLILKMKKAKRIEDINILNKVKLTKEKLNIKRKITVTYGETAFIYGVIRPTLVIPKKLNLEQLDAILIHEFMHYKYKDLVINWIMTILRNLYWFNPIVWLVFNQMKKDCEVACDERVLETKIVNKKFYASALFENAIKSNKYIVGTTAFSKGKGNIKSRIMKISKYNKQTPLCIFLITLICTFTVAICLTNKPNKDKILTIDKDKIEDNIDKENNDKNTSDINNSGQEEIINKFDDVEKITIYHNQYNDENYKPVIVTDKNIIITLLNYLDKEVNTNNNEMSGVAVIDQSIIIEGSNEDKKEIKYSYDDLYEFGYIMDNNEKKYIDYSFFRLINALNEFRPKESNISDDVKELFNKYNWTPSFLISSENKVIPSDFMVTYSNYNVEKYYWNYCNEVSKNIGLDFSNLKSKKVTAEIYYLLEEMPEFALPDLTARGIVIRYKDKIVGAYIDTATHSDNVISLNRKKFKEITNMELSEWLIENSVDKKDDLYKSISKMSKEELIEAYFKSMENENKNMYLATESIETVFDYMFSNLNKSKLFNDISNEEFLPYAKKAEIIKIDTVDKSEIGAEDEAGEIFAVEVNLKLRSNAVLEDGVHIRFLKLVKESDGWKVVGDGTGP